MKNIKFLFVFSILAILFACEADYEPLNDYSDVDWYTSSFRTDVNVIGLEDYMSFSDLSQNETDHFWSFSDTSGCKFLTGTITRNDTAYYEFIDEDLDTVSIDETVHILFTKAGIQSVRLRNTFDEKVVFEGINDMEAVFEDGKWVIDTTFIVDVYDSIQSAFKVFYNDVEIANVNYDQQVFLSDSSTWPTQEIMAGESIKFVDVTTVGRPDTREWYLNGANPSLSNDSAATVPYYRLGTFTSRFVARRTGQNIPGGYKMKYVPLKIKVNKSTLPFVLTGDVVETEDEIIQLSVTGEIESFSGLEDDFTVHVTNSNGFDRNIEVQSAKVSSTQGTVIELKLAEAIYNSDVITVSYAGNTIKSLDERDLEAFTDVPVNMYAPNLFDTGVYGFETNQDYWTNATGVGTVEVTNEKSFSGDYSIKLQGESGDNWIAAEMIEEDAYVELTKGTTYTLSWKLWRDPAAGQHNALGPWLAWDGGAGGSQQFWTGMNSLPQGEWIDIVKDYNYNGSGGVWFWIRVKEKNLIYVDDISIVVKEARPTE